jgi:hypothetical protein
VQRAVAPRRTKAGHWKAKFTNRTAYMKAKDSLQRAQLAKGGRGSRAPNAA